MADESMIERLTQVVLTEARENGADSPVDYGDAEQIVKAVLRSMKTPSLAMRKVSSFEVAEIDYPAMIDAALNEL